MIKESLDKKFGGPWHVVAGSAFAYEVTHEVSSTGNQAYIDASQREACHVSYATSMPGYGCHAFDDDALVHVQTEHALAAMQCRTLLFLYIGGKTGVLTWKL